MRAVRRFLPWMWLVVPVAAMAMLWFGVSARVRHIDAVSALAGGDVVAIDAASPTGYERGVRILVPPERDARSLQWIVQAQDMVRRGEWRLRHVDYDNAPTGRPVWTP